MKIDVIRDEEEFKKLEPHWNHLLRQSSNNNIFLTFEFISIWWKHFGMGKQLFILVAKDHDKIIGIAPLMITKKKIEFIGSPLSDYSGFIIKRQKRAAREFIECILSLEEEWNTVSLTQIPEAEYIKEIFERIEGKKFISSTRISRNFSFAKELGGIMKIYKKLRKKVTSKIESKELSMVQVDSLEEINSSMNHFMKFHIKRVRQMGERSHFENPRMKGFYEELSGILSARGWLSFWKLKLKGKDVGYHYGFDYNMKFLFYNQAYDPESSYLSPGKVMLAYLIDYSHKKGLDEFDLSRGEEPYKTQFSNSQRLTYDFVLCKGYFGYLFQSLYHRIREFMQEHPRFYRNLRLLVNYISHK